MNTGEILRLLITYQDLDSKLQKLRDDGCNFRQRKDLLTSSLIGIEKLFKERNETRWVEYYKSLKQGERLPIVVEVEVVVGVVEFDERGYCPGCNLALPTILLDKAQRLEEVATCENCGRIILPTLERAFQKMTWEEIKRGYLKLPSLVELRCSPGEEINFVDFWNQSWPAQIEDKYVVGLGQLFEKYSLEPNDCVFIQELSGKERKYQLTPELLSENDKTKILVLLENSKMPSLADIVDLVLRKKADIFGYPLIKGELIKTLLEESQFKNVRDKVIVKRKRPKSKIKYPKEEENKVVQSRTLGIETRFKLTEEALKEGYFIIGKNLRYIFESFDEQCYITIVAHVDYEFKAVFSKSSWSINELAPWYKENELGIGDTVYLKVEDIPQKKFRLYTDWRRDIDKLRELIKEVGLNELKEMEMSCRDAVYAVLQSTGGDLHYRDIHERVQEIHSTKLATVVGALSRYNGRVFANIGKGRWGLSEWYPDLLEKGAVAVDEKSEIEVEMSSTSEDALWEAIVEIETNDLVYETLKRQRADLFYEDIAKILGRMLRVDPKRLIETSFVNPQDERLFRNEDGSWTLKEFMGTENEQEPEQAKKKPSGRNFKKRALFIALVVILTVLIILIILKFLHKDNSGY